jgi:hypothetical protein
MRLLLDTNILLDVLLNRDPWVEQASDEGEIAGYIVACAVADIFYIAFNTSDILAFTPS